MSVAYNNHFKQYIKAAFAILQTISLLYLGSLSTVSIAMEAESAAAAYMYRYKTESGEQTVGFQVPAHAIKHGYEILNKRLRVVKVIPPAPTEEELAAIQQQSMTAKEEERLLAAFSSSADAIRARDRKIGALDVIIKITQSNIHRLNIEYETLASQAANIQRKGGSIPDLLEENMASIIRQINDADNFIRGKQTEIDAIYEDYGDDISKLQKIESRNKSVSAASN